MIINDFKDLNMLLESEGIKLQEQVAGYNISDSDISGGRKIVDAKSNQLFTGRFEERDVLDFIRIWSRYRSDNLPRLKNELIKTCDAIIRNYHAEVSPIEVMLYTSNTISSSFSNFKLAEVIAEVVVLVWKKQTSFLNSIEHIVNVWAWGHVINICAIAVGKICAEVTNDNAPVELMHSIFDRYRYDDQTRQGCFMGAIESQKDEFIPDILNVVHDLKGTDSDKIIGNLFKRKFFISYSGYYGQLNADMFADASPYARELVKKILQDGSKDTTLVGRYQNATSLSEKKGIIEEGIERIKGGQGVGVYDAVNMLKMAGSGEISERMYELLKLDSRKNAMLPIISYFGSVNNSSANRDMKAVAYENDYYSACRIALFRQSEISSDELMAGYLSETRPNQMKNYLSGFAGLNDKITDVKNSAFVYFSRQLNDLELKNAIGNYEKLIRKYKHLYNPQIGNLFMSYFGFGTTFAQLQIRMQEQNTCLSIIEMIIDSSNYKKYEDFLYYVAEEGMAFTPTIASHAREILRNINSDRIKF
ncbi:MAG: hypothetical protein IJ794_13325 [Lachnospiraceae bacterium]|nr:hypothetical protein [Lachnospiraceae bacterium]